jgi:hypothetical protein
MYATGDKRTSTNQNFIFMRRWKEPLLQHSELVTYAMY